jgi:hypothetical protein
VNENGGVVFKIQELDQEQMVLSAKQLKKAKKAQRKHIKKEVQKI